MNDLCLGPDTLKVDNKDTDYPNLNAGFIK